MLKGSGRMIVAEARRKVLTRASIRHLRITFDRSRFDCLRVGPARGSRRISRRDHHGTAARQATLLWSSPAASGKRKTSSTCCGKRSGSGAEPSIITRYYGPDVGLWVKFRSFAGRHHQESLWNRRNGSLCSRDRVTASPRLPRNGILPVALRGVPRNVRTHRHPCNRASHRSCRRGNG